MSVDLKQLLEQFGKDYWAQQATDLMAEARTLQAGEPRMSFDEAWTRAKASHETPFPVEEIPRE